MIKIMGREWKWWLMYCDHTCKFCWNENYPHGKTVAALGHQTGLVMVNRGYYHKLYYVWLRHMKTYHAELLKPPVLVD